MNFIYLLIYFCSKDKKVQLLRQQAYSQQEKPGFLDVLNLVMCYLSPAQNDKLMTREKTIQGHQTSSEEK